MNDSTKENYVLDDLFDIGVQPYENVKIFFEDQAEYQNFLNYIWFGWLFVTYYSEVSATLIYDYLSDKVDPEFRTFFEDSSIEELEHAKIFEDILVNLIPNFSKLDYTKTKKDIIEYLSSRPLCTQLVEFLAGEIAILAPGKLFYKQTSNSNKKKLLSIVLAEENGHVATILSMLTKIIQRSTTSDKVDSFKRLKEIVSFRRYLSYPWIVDYINENESNNEVKISKFKQIYSSLWLIDCEQLLLQSYFKIAKVFQPDLTIEEFDQMTSIKSSLLTDYSVDLSFLKNYNYKCEHGVAAVCYQR